MITIESLDSGTREFLSIKRRHDLLFTSPLILTHVLVKHGKHNKRKDCQTGQKDHEWCQIPAEDFERTIIHESGLSVATNSSSKLTDSTDICRYFGYLTAKQRGFCLPEWGP